MGTATHHMSTTGGAVSGVDYLIGRLSSEAPMHGRLTTYVKLHLSQRIPAGKVTLRCRRLPAH